MFFGLVARPLKSPPSDRPDLQYSLHLFRSIMLKRSLLLATLALSFASSAFASFPKWKVEGAVRRGCGIGSDWKL